MATTTQLNDTDIQGKASVSRHHNVGGDLHVEGKGRIDHDLDVEGTLRAREIAGLEDLLLDALRKLSDSGDGLASKAELALLIKELRDLISAGTGIYLSREHDDRALGLIKLLAGAEFGNFISGATGSGGRIDRYGNGELQSLILHRFLEVPELRYNRVYVEIGNKWRAAGGGIVERCVPDRDQYGNLLMTGTVTLHLEDGEIGAVAEDDICQGIFHMEADPGANSGITADDGRGNFLFAGFCTVYFRITEILNQGNNSKFRYVLRPVSDRWPHSYHPTEGMHFAGYGNFTKKERQTSRYSTRTYERYLKDVNDWELTGANVAAQFGDLSNMSEFGLMLSGYSAYLNNIFMTGILEQVKALFPRIEFDTEGDTFLAYGERKKITCKVFRGWDEVTDKVTKWTITRDTGDPVEDASWNMSAKAQGFKGSIEISFTAEENDLGTNTFVVSTLFTVKADLSDGESVTEEIRV